MAKHAYAAVPKFLLRIPLFSAERLCVPTATASGNGGQRPSAVSAALADPMFRAAIAVASGSLYSEILNTRNWDDLEPRTASKLFRYLIRMSTRPTPYGLFAGVTLGAWGTQTSPEFKLKVRTSSRVDFGWLQTFLASRARNPAARDHLPLVANPVITRFGEHVYLQDVVEAGKGQAKRSVSVRTTKAVDFVLAQSRVPISWRELRGRVVESFSASASLVAKVDKLLEQLCDAGFLRADLLPGTSANNSARETLSWLETFEASSEELREYEQIVAELEEWDWRDQADRDLQYHLLTQRAMRLSPHHGGMPFQTDTAIDPNSTIVTSMIADETSAAAELLLQLSRSPEGPRYLHEYRQRFLDRYGENRLVPLLDVLQDDVGIGVPRFDEERSQDRERNDPADRNDVLAELVANALRTQTMQVELSDELLSRLRNSSSLKHWPTTVELFVMISARCAEDLDRGDFRLIVGPAVGSLVAGRAIARFAFQLGPEARDLLSSTIVRDLSAHDVIHAEVTYRPSSARLCNVTVRPIVTPYEIPVGIKPAVDPAFVIALDDLLLGVDRGRFFLFSKAHSKRVHAHWTHMLNASAEPTVLRFLSDVSQDSVTQLMAFDWGASKPSPFLPRITRGRLVLSLAQWKLSLGQLKLGDRPTPQAFIESLGEWLECPVFSVPVRDDKTGIERSLRWHEGRSIRQSKL